MSDVTNMDAMDTGAAATVGDLFLLPLKPEA
jgi:hypothetical protein